MKNIYETKCGTLEIDLLNTRMAVIVYENDPYYSDQLEMPVKIYRGCFQDYGGEKGVVVWGWTKLPFIDDATEKFIDHYDVVFFREDLNKIYDFKTGRRIF